MPNAASNEQGQLSRGDGRPANESSDRHRNADAAKCRPGVSVTTLCARGIGLDYHQKAIYSPWLAQGRVGCGGRLHSTAGRPLSLVACLVLSANDPEMAYRSLTTHQVWLLDFFDSLVIDFAHAALTLVANRPVRRVSSIWHAQMANAALGASFCCVEQRACTHVNSGSALSIIAKYIRIKTVGIPARG
ncbi:hypothetical protein [Lacipirellula sp.]|uniref:hypothetical protein n=1 Tax=Lacipirellula sp. TaxID=2691419 RepID=UPI003D0CCFFD